MRRSRCFLIAAAAAVSGVRVSLKNTRTGLAREVTAHERGAYLVPDLPAAQSEPRILSPAFAPCTQRGVEVSSNGVVRLDLQLELAGAAEKVTVGASGPLLQTDRSDVRTEIASRQFEDMPGSRRAKLPVTFQARTYGHKRFQRGPERGRIHHQVEWIYGNRIRCQRRKTVSFRSADQLPAILVPAKCI